MKLYRLKHNPTGMYFKPSKHKSPSNLSKTGKIYATMPSLSYVRSGYYHPLPDKKTWPYKQYEHRKYIEQDWCIEEVNP